MAVPSVICDGMSRSRTLGTEGAHADMSRPSWNFQKQSW